MCGHLLLSRRRRQHAGRQRSNPRRDPRAGGSRGRLTPWTRERYWGDPGAALRSARVPRLPRRGAGGGGRRERARRSGWASSFAPPPSLPVRRVSSTRRPSSKAASPRPRGLGTAVLVTGWMPQLPPQQGAARRGSGSAVGGHVLVYVHKELKLDHVERRYPSERYVLVDDKPRILAVAKALRGRARDDGAAASGAVLRRKPPTSRPTSRWSGSATLT